MTTTTPTPAQLADAEIRRAITHVQTAYPAGTGDWPKRRFETWVKAVRDIDPHAVTLAAERLIRDWADDYGRPPQPGHLRARALSAATEKRGRTGHGSPDLGLDEAALRDAINALAATRDTSERELIEASIQSIRRRLPDRGARFDRRTQGGVRHLEAEHDPTDPPGTVRYVVIQPDGTRRPKGGRVLGEGRDEVARYVAGVPHVDPGPEDSLESGRAFPRGPLNGG